MPRKFEPIPGKKSNQDVAAKVIAKDLLTAKPGKTSIRLTGRSAVSVSASSAVFLSLAKV